MGEKTVGDEGRTKRDELRNTEVMRQICCPELIGTGCRVLGACIFQNRFVCFITAANCKLYQNAWTYT